MNSRNTSKAWDDMSKISAAVGYIKLDETFTQMVRTMFECTNFIMDRHISYTYHFRETEHAISFTRPSHIEKTK